MRRANRFLLMLIVVFAICTTYDIYAQNNASSFETISIKDGLSHNEVWAFEQDKYGYMWIATRDGLNKYDGYNFKIYKNDPADSTTLPSNQVRDVLEDKQGVLWIATINGLSKYDRKSDDFKNYQFNNSSQEMANAINYLFEDSKGNLWLSTDDGILSFDKQKKAFKNYELLREDNVVVEQSFPTYILIETDVGVLFASSIAYGILKFDYENNLFIQLKLKNNYQDKISGSTILSMIEDTNGSIWYGTFNGLYKIDINTLTVEQTINSLTGRPFPSTGGLYETKDRKIWIGTWLNGLYQYDLSTRKTTRIPFPGQGFFDFTTDRTGILWMSCFAGIVKYNFDKAPIKQYAFKTTDNQDRPIPLSFSLSKKFSNIVWIGTNKGIFVFDKAAESLTNTLSVIPKIRNGNELNVEDLVETDGGKLYVGTSNKGLFSISLSSGTISHYEYERYSPTSLLPFDVNTLYEDSQNRLWVGQELGLSILNESEKTFTRIPSLQSRQYDEKLVTFLHQLRKVRTPLLQMIEVGDFADLSKEFVLSEDSHVLISGIGEGIRERGGMFDYGVLQTVEGDTLWSMRDYMTSFNASGSHKNRQKIGIMELNKGRYKLLYKSDDSHSVQSYNQEPPQDSLYWGIELYTISGKEFQIYKALLDDDNKATFMNGPNVMSVFESSDKLIWVSTMSGLSIIDPQTLSVENITSDSQSDISISSNFVEDICEDNFGNIWIATQDGLNQYDRKRNYITVFKEKEGLPTNGIRALQLDDEGNLWASSIKGISKVEISDSSKHPVFVNYDATDGLQGYTFIGNAAIKDNEGKMFFAGPDGFNVLKPGVTDKSLPNIVFNNISISNNSIDELDEGLLESKDLNSLEKINLSYNQNDITFEFASIHFARPNKNRLQYMMEGIDESWHDGSKQIATYANLDPGDYVFKVRGSNGDGFWTEKPKELKLTITPAWWNNTYAYFAYGLIFFGFLYGVRKYELDR